MPPEQDPAPTPLHAVPDGPALRAGLSRLRERGVHHALIGALGQTLGQPLNGRAARRWFVGFSGGADSTALLLGAVMLRAAWQAEGRRLPVLQALHVHHGLAAAADDWAARARAIALGLGVPMLDLRVQVKGRSETAARVARYEAFARVLRDGDLLLLAHHADDDAETVLMDVLRGAGVRAMPSRRALGAGTLVRPLLGLARETLAAVVDVAGIHPVVDPANADPVHARSLVRHRMLPLAEAQWPGATRRLRQLARAQSERDAALALLLQPLLRRGVDEDGGLQLALLRGQPLPVARALLSAWLMPHVGPVPVRHLGELLRQLLTAPDTGRVASTLRGHQLRCHRDTAYLLANAGPASAPAVGARRSRRDEARAGHAASWRWDGRVPLNLAVGGLAVGRLHRLPAIQGMRWPEEGVLVRLRAGGERLQLHADGPRREVKALLREAGVPVWQRARWPLVYLPGASPGQDDGPGQAPMADPDAGAMLLAVPAVGVAHGWRVDPGAPGFTLAFDPVRATV